MPQPPSKRCRMVLRRPAHDIATTTCAGRDRCAGWRRIGMRLRPPLRSPQRTRRLHAARRVSSLRVPSIRPDALPRSNRFTHSEDGMMRVGVEVGVGLRFGAGSGRPVPSYVHDSAGFRGVVSGGVEVGSGLIIRRSQVRALQGPSVGSSTGYGVSQPQNAFAVRRTWRRSTPPNAPLAGSLLCGSDQR